MNFSQITGTGRYLPKKILTNDDLSKMVETSDEWISSRTGIKQRHIACKEETSAFMATRAAKQAMQCADIDPAQIDMLIVASSTPDKVFPSTACLIQKDLGLGDCPAFDIAVACAGFNFALSIADQYIKTSTYKHILVVGVENMSSIIDWQDRNTCILFGDGAGAVVVSASEQPGIHASCMHSDGSYKDLLFAPKADMQDGEFIPPYVQMHGSEVFKIAVRKLGDAVLEVMEQTDFTVADIDWLVPHQANSRIIEAVAKKLGLPMDKVIMTVDRHGNTSAASIPLALDEAVKEGKIKPGQLVLLESFGGGFAWGATLLTY